MRALNHLILVDNPEDVVGRMNKVYVLETEWFPSAIRVHIVISVSIEMVGVMQGKIIRSSVDVTQVGHNDIDFRLGKSLVTVLSIDICPQVRFQEGISNLPMDVITIGIVPSLCL